MVEARYIFLVIYFLNGFLDGFLEKMLQSRTDQDQTVTGNVNGHRFYWIESGSRPESLEAQYRKQAGLGRRLFTKCSLLHEENNSVVRHLPEEVTAFTVTHLVDTVHILQDLSAHLLATAENLNLTLSRRADKQTATEESGKNKCGQEITDLAESLITKVLELKRSLTYICAASDMTAPGRKSKTSSRERKFLYHRSLSSEAAVKTGSVINTSDEEETTADKVKLKRKAKLVKSKSEDCQPNYIKQLMTGNSKRDKLETLRKSSLEGTAEHAKESEESQAHAQKQIIVELHKKREQRKLLRTRRISDGYVSYKDSNSEQSSALASHVVVPTSTQYVDAMINEAVPLSPVSIFVQTTRKLFTPFVSEAFDTKQNKNSLPESAEEREHEPANLASETVITLSESPSKKQSEEEKSETAKTSVSIENTEPNPRIYLPPLPNSPAAQRRERTVTKETSPAIRIMIARYNQKLSEQENPGYKSGGSSGSASPVAWRSPVLERRVKTQSEKYQEEVNKTLNKHSPLFVKKQVQKSASVGVMNGTRKQITIPQCLEKHTNETCSRDPKSSPKSIRGILKSSSVDCLKRKPPLSVTSSLTQQSITPDLANTSKPSMLSTCEEEITKHMQERAYKLQKAKEQFFQSTINPVPSTSTDRQPTEETKIIRNRLSQVSFGSESSCDETTASGLLIKSASAGMINIEEEAYQQFRPEMHSQGYVSLPRSTKRKEERFGISSITSRFRKVKIRRNRDCGMNTVSTLCRQSLVVDINVNERNSERRKEEKYSWLKNPARIFKPK